MCAYNLQHLFGSLSNVIICSGAEGSAQNWSKLLCFVLWLKQGKEKTAQLYLLYQKLKSGVRPIDTGFLGLRQTLIL